MSEQFLSLKDLCERYGTTPQVIYGLRYRHDGPRAFKVGRELRWRLSDVEKWEAERIEKPL